MQIWLKQGNKSIRFPVNPSTFEVGTTQNNTSVNINSIGEIKLIGKRNLKTVAFSSFFPSQAYGFVQYKGFPKPYDCVKLIEGFMGAPAKLTITGANVSMLVAIESFTYSEQDGTKDVYFSLELTEYKRVKPVVLNTTGMNTNVIPVINLRDAKPIVTKYTAKGGETLSSVAKKTTGTTGNVNSIARLNNIKSTRKLSRDEEVYVSIW